MRKRHVSIIRYEVIQNFYSYFHTNSFCRINKMFLLNNFLFTNIVYKAIAFSFCLIITVQNVFGVYINDTRNLFKRQQLEEYRVCTSNFVIYQERIIRTEESKKSGAKYLSGKDVTSKEECIKFCCKTPNCDVFVLEEKVFNQV